MRDTDGYLRTARVQVTVTFGRSRILLRLPYKEGVGGSSPSAPTANVLVRPPFLMFVDSALLTPAQKVGPAKSAAAALWVHARVAGARARSAPHVNQGAGRRPAPFNGR